MQYLIPLEYGKIYHIYNRGINKCDIFYERTNYQHFIRLYEKHINPIADTFAWVLMKNHFHFMVRIKDEEEIKNYMANLPVPKKPRPPHVYFSNLFNAYCKAFNKKYNRCGSLFQARFKRKVISDMEHFRTIVLYIHKNPVRHNFVDHIPDYPWSSYHSCVTLKPPTIDCSGVVGFFDGEGNFQDLHNEPIDYEEIEKYLGLEYHILT